MTHETPVESQDFGVLLNLAFGAFKARLHAELARAGHDDLGSSFGYVFRLLAGGPAILRELAEGLDMSAPGALKIVNEMVARGYVERRDHPVDARQKLLALTPRARRAMQVAHRFHLRFEAELAQRLGARDAAAARRVLEAIVAAEGEGAGVRLAPR
ncbi:MAG: MarR family winged helix-turn-helix transcriptional regulator [Burkholderiaceae bacterium]